MTSRLPIQEAREKLRATISKQANTLNMLDYQLRQRCRARDKLQRQLQQRQRLLKEELDETKKQKQVPRTPLPGVAAPMGGLNPSPAPPG